jgi:hypothetical protein
MAVLYLLITLPTSTPIGPAPDSFPAATRAIIGASAWIYVIWRCWQDSVAYDPAKHNALQNILARQQAGGAAAAGPGNTR